MPVVEREFEPGGLKVSAEALYVFDFDGVVIDSAENDIYELPESDGEAELLAKARAAFKIPCEGMKLPYQRHLLYQAALLRTGGVSLPGPAYSDFENARLYARVFVLTARSGWHATERARRFVAREPYPIELYHIGRVPKYLQLARLREEFPDRHIVYLEDSADHVRLIKEYFDANLPAENNLEILHVQRVVPALETAELRARFSKEMEAAFVAPGTDQTKDSADDLAKLWERFCEAAHSEKEWMAARFNWLLVSQPILFTALAFAVKERKLDCSVQAPTLTPAQQAAAAAECLAQNPVLDKVRLLVIGLGLAISSLVFIALIAAGRMHWTWTSNLNLLAAELNAKAGPVATFGLKPHWPARTSSLIAPTLAFIFIAAWTYLLFTVIESGRLVGLTVAADLALVAFVVLVARRVPPVPGGKRSYAELGKT